MQNIKREKSKYQKKLIIRKRLSGSSGYLNTQGKKFPLPLPLFQEV